ncbi:teichoic acid biosynthesis protein A [Geotalea uraniireducens]|uniref:Teichoic acid biosynthesis protein A n=2 Tax=Geotalea uraniireducens TaxID=351604 RepID=A0ABM8ELW9_9BACT|nr:teichoic acid biosynthesis protein A [Geotalea uraniireducens]
MITFRHSFDRNFKLPRLNTFLNPYSYLIARKSPELFNKFNIYPDGIALVVFLRLFLLYKCERQSFDMTSLARVVFESAEQQGKSVYLIGTEDRYIIEAVSNISHMYSNLNICGFRNGFFYDQNDRSEALNDIYVMSPDIVVVGMGTPAQEQFLYDLWRIGWRGIGFTCGGFFHQSAKSLDYYPCWMDKLHLRWLYRIFDEPKLFKRYAFQYPRFIWYFTLDCISCYLQNR